MVPDRLRSGEMKAILDTNALLLPYQEKFDVISAIQELIPNAELVILESTLRELSLVKDVRAAKLAFQIIEKNNIESVPFPGETDSAIIRYAKENGAVVVTKDLEMLDKCRKVHVKVMLMKKNKTAKIEGE
jgi:rRNA-processing protein FCF1